MHKENYSGQNHINLNEILKFNGKNNKNGPGQRVLY